MTKGLETNLDNKLAIYRSIDGSIQLDVKLENETVWLNHYQMAHLYGVDRSVISRHIKNIYKSGELEESATCAKIAQVQIEGKRTVRREFPYYSLDMIISVGYRDNSKNATQFRIWATKVLKDYIIKGVAQNNRRLEQLGQMVKLLKTAEKHLEASEILSVIERYSQALDLLDIQRRKLTHCRRNLPLLP